MPSIGSVFESIKNQNPLAVIRKIQFKFVLIIPAVNLTSGLLCSQNCLLFAQLSLLGRSNRALTEKKLQFMPGRT